MLPWVLILFFSTANGAGVTSVDMASEAACNKAGEAARSVVSSFHLVRYVCVERGAPR